MQPRNQSANFKVVELPKPQTTLARCYGVIHVGMVPNTYANETKMQDKLMVLWELPNLNAVFDEEKGPQPFSIMEEFTFSTDDRSNFSKLIANWRNRPLDENEKKSFDPTQLVDKVCMMGFVHKTKKDFRDKQFNVATNENTAMRLNSIQPVPKEIRQSTGVPPLINEKIIWDWWDIRSLDDFDKNKWERIPKYIRRKMRTSEEFIRLKAEQIVGTSDDAQDNQQPQQQPQQQQPRYEQNFNQPQQNYPPQSKPGGVQDDDDGWDV